MGKPKQRSRQSFGHGFPTAQKVQKMNARDLKPGSDSPGGTRRPDILPQFLKEVHSGKVSKPKRKKQNILSLLNTEQVLESGQIQCTNTRDVNTVVQNPSSSSVPLSTRKQMKIQVRSKKARQLSKREAFQKKIEIIKGMDKSKKAAKARQKTVIVGDMMPMLDALPAVSLDSELQNLVNQCYADVNTKSEAKRTKLKMKKRNEEIAQGLDYFAAGLSK